MPHANDTKLIERRHNMRILCLLVLLLFVMTIEAFWHQMAEEEKSPGSHRINGWKPELSRRHQWPQSLGSQDPVERKSSWERSQALIQGMGMPGGAVEKREINEPKAYASELNELKALHVEVDDLAHMIREGVIPQLAKIASATLSGNANKRKNWQKGGNTKQKDVGNTDWSNDGSGSGSGDGDEALNNMVTLEKRRAMNKLTQTNNSITMNKSNRPNISQEVESIEGIDKNEENDVDEDTINKKTKEN